MFIQGKKIGEMFKALTPAEKLKYEELAKNDKQRYLDEMKSYEKKQKAEKEADNDGVDDEHDDDDDESDSD